MNSSSAAIATGRSSSSVSCAFGIAGSNSAVGSRDGRARDLSGAHDDHARDRALRPGIRNAWNRFALRAGGSWRVDETNVKIKGRGPISSYEGSKVNRRFPVSGALRNARPGHSNVVPGGIHDDGITNADGKCRRNAGCLPARRRRATIMPKRAGISRCPSSRCGVQRRIQMFVTEH
jgi:hypothetical protein